GRGRRSARMRSRTQRRRERARGACDEASGRAWPSSGGPLYPPMARRRASPAGYLPSRGDRLELVNVSSRQRYRGFVRDYKRRRLDEAAEPGDSQRAARGERRRSEEHTSELQSRRDLVCRLLLEKKKNKTHGSTD